MSYNSKFTGQQADNILSVIKTDGTGGGYLTDDGNYYPSVVEIEELNAISEPIKELDDDLIEKINAIKSGKTKAVVTRTGAYGQKEWFPVISVYKSNPENSVFDLAIKYIYVKEQGVLAVDIDHLEYMDVFDMGIIRFSTHYNKMIQSIFNVPDQKEENTYLNNSVKIDIHITNLTDLDYFGIKRGKIKIYSYANREDWSTLSFDIPDSGDVSLNATGYINGARPDENLYYIPSHASACVRLDNSDGTRFSMNCILHVDGYENFQFQSHKEIAISDIISTLPMFCDTDLTVTFADFEKSVGFMINEYTDFPSTESFTMQYGEQSLLISNAEEEMDRMGIITELVNRGDEAKSATVTSSSQTDFIVQIGEQQYTSQNGVATIPISVEKLITRGYIMKNVTEHKFTFNLICTGTECEEPQVIVWLDNQAHSTKLGETFTQTYANDPSEDHQFYLYLNYGLEDFSLKINGEDMNHLHMGTQTRSYEFDGSQDVNVELSFSKRGLPNP